MGSHRASIRYAKSLIELSQEQNSLEKVKEDMILFSNVIESNRDFANILKNPVIQTDKKRKVLKAIFDKRVQPLTLKAFELILTKNRENMLAFIATDFINEYNILKGIAVAHITTPFTLDNDQRKQVNELVTEITGKKPELIEEVNETIIGGFVLKIGDRQIDESVKTKLTKIQRALVA